MKQETKSFTIPNPLLQKHQELVECLERYRPLVNDMLLNKLAGQILNDAAFRIKDCPHPLAEVKATAIVLRILTKQSWDRDDMQLLNALWRQTSCTALFGEEFEAERFRIQACVEEGRQQLASSRWREAR